MSGPRIKAPAGRPYFLGCPMWSNRDWVGQFYTSDAKPADYLAQYSSVLSSVEGNTTFYAIPAAATVAKWRAGARTGFRFCFKIPRAISHDKALRHAEAETEAFFTAMEPLRRQLGPFFLQLPPHFDDFAHLERFLVNLPRDHHFAVEVRSPRFFRGDQLERDLEHMLRDLNMDRVVFDTRRLMALPTEDPELQAAQRRKPKAPVRFEALGPHPFLRYVGYPEIEEDRKAIAFWAERCAQWIREGRTPFVFMHQAPDDARAPELCRMFHGYLQQHLPEIEDLPPNPRDEEPPPEEQLTLF